MTRLGPKQHDNKRKLTEKHVTFSDLNTCQRNNKRQQLIMELERMKFPQFCIAIMTGGIIIASYIIFFY
jgi:hypothetical protein